MDPSRDSGFGSTPVVVIDPGSTKAETRAVVADARRRSTGIDQEACRRALAAFLAPIDGWVLVYDAMGDEVDLGPLIDAAPDPTTRFAVTRTPDHGDHLTVHPWGGPYQRHRYGYRQPAPDAPRLDPADLAAVLVPGLAFDRFGARLGRGRGYYDRLLSRVDPACPLVGMTAGLLADRLPVEDHDVVMTHLALERAVVAVATISAGPPPGRPAPRRHGPPGR